MELIDGNYYLFKCPHCNIDIQVMKNEVNCTIFRCGILKDSCRQISPHETKMNCDQYIKKESIFGCGNPFRLIKINGVVDHVEICDYI